MDEAKQKVKVAEEKLNRQIARYELLVNENHSLKVDLVKAEKKAKEVSEREIRQRKRKEKKL